MALEMIRVNVPDGFNPGSRRHVTAVIENVKEQKGDGWEVQSYDAGAGQLTLTRAAALTEMNGQASDTFEVSLGYDVKTSEGERTAQRLEEDNPGYFLTEFRPHVKRARLTRMSDAEVRCRDAVANVIGCPRWEVQVRTSTSGGFALQLPPKYTPARHLPALQGVAEEVVGRRGWYVTVDASTLTGEITPAEEPTFEPVYPFDFDALSTHPSIDNPDLFRIPLGKTLGKNGEANGELVMDLSDSVGTLAVGLAGSGKSTTVQAVVFSALAKHWQLALINTVDKATDFMWAKPYVRDGMWGCDTVAQSVAVAKLVTEEAAKRGDLLSEHGVQKWQDLPADVREENPPLLLVADELAALLIADPLPSGLSSDMKALPEFMRMQQDLLESKLLMTTLSKLPATCRAAGIRVLYLTQQPNEKYGFSTTLKGNLPHRVMLGTTPSRSEKGHAFRRPDKVPDVPANIAQDDTRARGVGLAHLDGQEPVVMKGYYASLDSYLAEADRRDFPQATFPAPSLGTIQRLVPSILDEGHDGYGHGDRVYEDWELDADGTPLTGLERANAARHEATQAMTPE